MAPFIVKLVEMLNCQVLLLLEDLPTLFYFDFSPVITFLFLVAVMLFDQRQLGGGWQADTFLAVSNGGSFEQKMSSSK